MPEMVQVEAAYKAEITNIAGYLNTNYKVDPFVYFVKSYESTQPTVNSLIKTMTMCRNVCFVSLHCSYFKQYTSRMPGVKRAKRMCGLHKEIPTRCNNEPKLVIPYLYEAQHVLGDTPPIIRSLKLH
jgi:hypothetical protein